MANSLNDKRLVDIIRIQEIFGEDKSAIHEFFNNFVQTTKELLDDIKLAIKNKDAQLAQTSFHRLKGNSGNSGVMAIHQLCIRAEDRVLAKDWDEVDNLLKEIENTFKKLREKLADQTIL